MRRVRKIALWVVGVVLTLGVVGYLGLQWYLGTGSARRMVAGEVSKAIGLPVEVTSVSVGFGGTSVGIVIPDADAETPTDFIRIGKIETDITLGGLLTGSATPTKVTVKDADIILRLDANRKIVSPMPKLEGGGGDTKLPAVKVENARVRIRQPGKPEFDVAGVNAELRAEGEGSVVTGTISDPKWGEWRIDGRLGEDPADGSVTLTNDGLTVTDPKLLNSIPFVKEKVWKHLSATGPLAATVTIPFKPNGDVDYDVTVKPKGATVTSPDADVTVTQVTGDIHIAGGKVTATNAQLSLAGGTVQADGGFDFGGDVYLLTLKAKASGLDMRKLPTSWRMPKEIEGQLKGTANLEVHIPDSGKLDTRGSGSGEVENAKLFGLDTKSTEIKLQLKGGDGRYRFETMQAK